MVQGEKAGFHLFRRDILAVDADGGAGAVKRLGDQFHQSSTSSWLCRTQRASYSILVSLPPAGSIYPSILALTVALGGRGDR